MVEKESVKVGKVKENIIVYYPDIVREGKLIDSVKIKDCKPFLDDRGFILELGRATEVFFEGFNFKQANYTETRGKGTIKAFHYHLTQTDYWFFCKGHAKVILVDLRVNSPTYLLANTINVGPPIYRTIKIPAGVAHGYENMSAETGLLYLVNQIYDPSDEYRIDPKSEELGYNYWGVNER